MSTGTAPAWQAREAQRQKLLNEITTVLFEHEDDLGDLNLYRLFLHLLDQKLALSRSGISNSEFTEIPFDIKEKILRLFSEVCRMVQQFQRTEQEEKALLATLFLRIASEIARPYLADLRRQEGTDPKKVYGVGNAMDEIPIEL